MRTLRDPGRNLKARFDGRPLELAERFGVMLPEKPAQVMQRLGIYDEDYYGPITPGVRELVEDVCLLEVHDAVAVGPRGGGKSLSVSFIEFYLWMIKNFECLNFGGSELQAANVYNYLLGYMEHDAFWKSLIKGESKISETVNNEDAWIKVLTASSKQVRSPHAGGWRMVKGKRVKRGGLLVIDEEAETEPELVEAVLPTINTAMPSVNVRCSTFHKAEGTFAEVVDNHVQMGYRLYQWDIFDVCQGCDCPPDPSNPRVCHSEEVCFREDHIEDYTDPDTGATSKRLVHKAYCGGRAKYARGWVPMEEILKLWKRGNRSHTKFEVEAMGTRPSMAGFVIKDRKAYSENCVDIPTSSLYQPGAPVSVCVDWGTIAAGVCVWQEQHARSGGVRHVPLHADLVEEAGTTQIMGIILGYWNRYINDVVEVAADIGGGGNYNNPTLREEHGLIVRDVNFNMEKEAAVAAWNIFNEAGKVVYPLEFEAFHRQIKNWKRRNGLIVKKDDHIMDASVCYFSKFIERLGLTNLRVLPRTMSSAPDVPRHGPLGRSTSRAREHSAGVGRAPLARTLGGSRRGRRRMGR